MKNFGLWLLRQSAVRLFGYAIAPLIAVALFYFKDQLQAASTFMNGAPVAIWVALLFGPTAVAVLIVAGFITYLMTPQGTRIDSRILQWWDLNPLRRVEIDLSGLFSYGRMAGVYCLPMLLFTVKLRRGRNIRLTECYIENLRTGAREDFLFSGPGPAMTLQDIQVVRKGIPVGVHLQQFDMTMEQFLDRWGGFKIVLAYDNKVFEREYSKQEVIKHLSKLWRNFHMQNL